MLNVKGEISAKKKLLQTPVSSEAETETQDGIKKDEKGVCLLLRNYMAATFSRLAIASYHTMGYSSTFYHNTHSSIVGSKPLSHFCGRHSNIASAFRAVWA